MLLRVLNIREENNESLDIVFHIVMANSSVISVSLKLLG